MLKFFSLFFANELRRAPLVSTPYFSNKSPAFFEKTFTFALNFEFAHSHQYLC